MTLPFFKKLLLCLGGILLLWLGARYVLPLMLPFLLGGLLALAAEPAVRFGVKTLHLRRGLASGLGVTVTLVLLGGILSILAAAAVKELKSLAGELPDVAEGVSLLQDRLLAMAESAPEGIRTAAQRSVLEIFDDGTALMRQVESKLPGMLTSVVSGVGSSFLNVGTGILSAFLISTRLPKLRERAEALLPESWKTRYLPAVNKVRNGLWGWIKAQGKLFLLVWAVVSGGLLLAGISYAPLWAFLIALVDAVPVLGTGIVLAPWGVVRLIQGDRLQAIGLFCTYGAAALTRTVLEPRLVGKQLGLDPLVTLLVVYVGFRLWGLPGLLLTPIIASAVKQLL